MNWQFLRTRVLQLILFLQLFFSIFPLVSSQLVPSALCPRHLPFGFPAFQTVPPSNSPLCRDGYFNLFDNFARIPIYAAYQIRPNETLGCTERTNVFTIDTDLTAFARTRTSQYANTGFDRGHNVPSADQAYSDSTQRQSFLMSNISPQLPGFNRGIWAQLEKTVRAAGSPRQRNHSQLIYTGAIYNNFTAPFIGNSTIDGILNGIRVPSHFYKIIVDLVSNETLAFLLPHAENLGGIELYISNIKLIESMSGIIFPVPINANKSTNYTLWDIQTQQIDADKAAACEVSSTGSSSTASATGISNNPSSSSPSQSQSQSASASSIGSSISFSSSSSSPSNLTTAASSNSDSFASQLRFFDSSTISLFFTCIVFSLGLLIVFLAIYFLRRYFAHRNSSTRDWKSVNQLASTGRRSTAADLEMNPISGNNYNY